MDDLLRRLLWAVFFIAGIYELFSNFFGRLDGIRNEGRANKCKDEAKKTLKNIDDSIVCKDNLCYWDC